ncbi:hypothetical protein [Conyzicola sp.]|uniref:hypothetical protein n=1 Tax=Conyzicola sp. TaxID=1969404 RepID=UPI00398A4AA5
MRRLAALSLVAALALTGCSSAGDPAPEATTTVEPTAAGTAEPTSGPTAEPTAVEYATLEDLRLALVSTGEPCASLQVLQGGPNADEPYGLCLPDNKWALYVYPTVEDLDAVVSEGDDSAEPGTFILGTNWLLGLGIFTSADDAAPVMAALGGTIWTANEPFER